MARYTHRVAISNDRLPSIDDGRVLFRYKDYARGGALRPISLEATEFIRRFLQHVLPRGFVRIRYFGLLANRTRKANLELARGLLKAQSPAQANTEREPWQDLMRRLSCVDPARCPRCGAGTLRRHYELPKDGLFSSRGPP